MMTIASAIVPSPRPNPSGSSDARSVFITTICRHTETQIRSLF